MNGLAAGCTASATAAIPIDATATIQAVISTLFIVFSPPRGQIPQNNLFALAALQRARSDLSRQSIESGNARFRP
jgi:hypothetical protein